MKTIKVHILKKASVAIFVLAIASSGAFAQREKNHTTQQRKSSRTIVKGNNDKSQSSHKSPDNHYQRSSASKQYKKYTDNRQTSTDKSQDNRKYDHNSTYNAKKDQKSYNHSKYDYKKYDHRNKHYTPRDHHISQRDFHKRHYSYYWSHHFPKTKIHHFSYHYEPKFYRHNFCRRIPRKSVYIELDGVGLFYYKGRFYHPVANGFYKVKAPMYIQHLPPGSNLELVHGKPYYHYHGIHFSLTSRGFRIHI